MLCGNSYEKLFGLVGAAFLKPLIAEISPAVSAASMSPLIWRCDKCFQPISSVADAHVEWLRHPCCRATDEILIVHYCGDSRRRECLRGRSGAAVGHGYLMNLPLSEFVGASGVVFLLDLLMGGDLDLENGLELFKRLHVPGYQACLDRQLEAIGQPLFGKDWDLEDMGVPAMTIGRPNLTRVGAEAIIRGQV